MKDRKPLRNLFAYFRRAWGPRAAYHLARVRLDPDWRTRFISMIGLANNRVPLTGAAPSLQFPGLL